MTEKMYQAERNVATLNAGGVANRVPLTTDGINMVMGQIAAAMIGNDVITATQIAADAIGSSELANGAVDTAAIGANAVSQVSFVEGSSTATLATTSTWTDMTDMAVTMVTTGGTVLVIVLTDVLHSVATTPILLSIRQDSGSDDGQHEAYPFAANARVTLATMFMYTPSAGSHTYKARWLTTVATATVQRHQILVIEFKK